MHSSEIVSKTNDESPMLPGGILKSADGPTFPVVRDAGGHQGDTIEWRFQFGEFLRLQIGNKWFRVSNFVDWRYHAKMMHNGQTWQENGSVTDLTNNGW